MKKSDLIKAMENQTPIAVSTHSFGREYPRYCDRAVVVAVEQSRAVANGGRSYYDHLVKDGVRVRYLDRTPKRYQLGDMPIVKFGGGSGHNREHEDTDERIVTARQCIAPWDEWQAEITRLDNAKAAAQAAAKTRSENYNQLAEQLQSTLRDLDIANASARVDVEWSRRSGQPYYKGITLSMETAKALLALLQEM